MGYFQDNTDQGGNQAGHYQSLEPVPGNYVPCCKIVPTPIVSSREVNAINDQSNVELLKSEEKILQNFQNDKNMVKLSLKRLEDLKCVSLDELCCSNLLSILYNDVRVSYSEKSTEGKICRRLLKKYQNLCRNDREFDEEDLPAVTDVSDDETLPVTNKKKRFKSMFVCEGD